MRILRTIAEMRRAVAEVRGGDKAHSAEFEVVRPSLGLVPTMGALHAGHLSLVRASRASCEHTVATIFVNPLQFAPNEDYARYPRTFDEDCTMLEREGVDLLFAPAAEEMLPAGGGTLVDVPKIGGRLDGASRPGHFRGVATIVAKLFHVVKPDCAFFGEKDATQLAVLRAMVRDLNFNLSIVGCATVRDADGLALSSRNQYLTAAERRSALALPRSLEEAAEALRQTQPVADVLDGLRRRLESSPGICVDYAEIVDPDTLLPVCGVSSGALIAAAAWIGERGGTGHGGTRLIDNVLIEPALERTCR